MKIEKLILDNFKGAKHREIVLSDKTTISGMNGSGKSTIADGVDWFFCDRDYRLKSNPDVKSINAEENDTTVTLVMNFGDHVATASKIQKCKKSKPDANGVSKIALNNTYAWNSIPMTERDFKAKFEEEGIDLDKYLALSHPESFVGQKAQEQRKVLFDMSESFTDKEIADKYPELSDVARELENYKLEEIVAINKASIKRLNEEVESIPNIIIGMERVKSDVRPLAEIEKGIEEAEKNYQVALEAKNARSEKRSELNNKKFMAERKVDEELRNANAEIKQKKFELETKLKGLEKEEYLNATSLASANTEVHKCTSEIEKLKAERTELGEKYNAVKAEKFTFDDSKYKISKKDTVCKYCGQPLPEDKISEMKENLKELLAKDKEKAKKKFEADKKEKMDLYLSIANGNKKKEQSLANIVGVHNAEIEKLNKSTSEISKSIEEVEAELNSIGNEVDPMTVESYKEALSVLESVNKEIQEFESDETSDDIDELSRVLSGFKGEREAYFHNEKIDIQIKEQIEKKLDAEQNKMTCEMILDQADLLSRKKNELLSESINKKFKLVNFKLFDYLKNGSYKECCVPMTKDGKTLGSSTNTALEIAMKLDIMSGLQEHFKMNIPVFIDNAECLDSTSIGKIDVPYQLVLLKVSDDKEIVVS